MPINGKTTKRVGLVTNQWQRQEAQKCMLSKKG